MDRRTLVPRIADKSRENVLFADSVSFQLDRAFHEKCRYECNTLVYLLPENQTDKVQPVDSGVGWTMKKKIEQSLDKWLEIEDNIDKWHDNLTAKERRIPMTKWVGDAWDELQCYQDFFSKAFQRTGYLMTIHGSEDYLIKPQEAMKAMSFKT